MKPDMVSLVFEFNEKVLMIDRPEKALLSEKELEYAVKAGIEELDEFNDAHKAKDFVGAVDAAIDQIYFQIGFLKRMGLTQDEVRGCFEAVHNANMEKKKGEQAKRAGAGVVDAVKPEGWVPPEERIAEVLNGNYS